MVGDGAAHHGARADHDVPADPCAGQDHGAGPDPAAGAYGDRVGAGPLAADGLVRVVVAVVGGGHVDVRAEVAVVADGDGGVGDDVAAAAEDHTVADVQDRVGAEVEVGHESGGEGDLLGDDAEGADAYPGLAEDGALRVGDAGAVAERAEPQPPRMLGGDGARLAHPAAAGLHGGVREAGATPGEAAGERGQGVLRHPATVLTGRAAGTRPDL